MKRCQDAGLASNQKIISSQSVKSGHILLKYPGSCLPIMTELLALMQAPYPEPRLPEQLGGLMGQC